MTVLTATQVRAFLVVTHGHRLAPLFLLAVVSGMREGELFALQWENVDWDGGAVRVQHSLDREGNLTTPKTESSRRRIDIPPEAMAALRDHRKRTIATGSASVYVFSDTAGNPLRKSNFLRRDFKPLLAKAGVPAIRFHDLRHTHASLLLAEGVNIKVIQERLGHAKIDLTLDHYSHLMPGQQRQAADKISALLNPPAPRRRAKRAGERRS